MLIHGRTAVVFDAHPLMLAAFETIFGAEEMELVAAVTTVAELLAAVELNEPQLVVVDLNGEGGGDGVDAVVRLRQLYPQLRVIGTISNVDRARMASAFAAGAAS